MPRRTIKDLIDLQGRTALVAGGAGHLGSMAAETLVELGATVSILDVDVDTARDRVGTLSRIRDNSANAVPCDLADEKSTREAVRKTVAERGGLDVLIHCAGYAHPPDVPGWGVPFEEQTVEAWDAAMQVYLTSAFVLVQEAKSALAGSSHGSVIFLASIYGMVGPDLRLYGETDMANPAGYGACKGGLLQLTRYLATILAPSVRVNAISPGGVWNNPIEAFQERYVTRTPLGRMATEEDLKGAVAYLASDLSAYVTGHNLVVDGGWTAW